MVSPRVSAFFQLCRSEPYSDQAETLNEVYMSGRGIDFLEN